MLFPAAIALAAGLSAPHGPPSSAALPGPDSLPLAAPRAEPSRPPHELATAGEAGLSLAALVRAESAVQNEMHRGAFPGAALAIGRGPRVVVEGGFGWTGSDDGDAPVDPDRTVYDLASLSKVVGTTTAVMLLVEDGLIRLEDPVSSYLPEFSGGSRDRVTIRHLLTHTSGLPAGIGLPATTPEAALQRALGTRLETAPGARVEYSDVGFVVLFAAAERAAGEPLYRLLDRRVFGPLGMRSTTYLAGEGCGRCAATSRDRGAAYRGKVHDPIARRLGGIAGNAGLFSTVHDVARFAAMLAGGGELNGTRVLRSSTIREFTRRQPGAGTRALGWDTPGRPGTGAAGARQSPHSFGHTGYTGTSIWIDAERGTWVVLLANRTYRTEENNRMQGLRREVHDLVATASDLSDGGTSSMGAGGS